MNFVERSRYDALQSSIGPFSFYLAKWAKEKMHDDVDFVKERIFLDEER